ncbi:MAG: DUF2442 domain-containing protein [Phycisphaerae bacterium]|nr:DUF2442 domain-containing protein [Phycisphaerae bacterium]
MSTSERKNREVEPTAVRVTPDLLSVDLADGRTISVPLQWYPRLFHGTANELENYELMYDGIHWPDLNEDVSVEGLLCGEKSGESPKSLRRWLEYRARGEKEPVVKLPLPSNMAKELKKIWAAEDRKKNKVRTAARHRRAS